MSLQDDPPPLSDEYVYPAESEVGRKGSGRRFFYWLAAIVVMAGTFFLGAYAEQAGWLSGGRGALMPILESRNEPVKVRPDQPGGLEIPHQDKQIYDRITGDEPTSDLAAVQPDPKIDDLFQTAPSQTTRPETNGAVSPATPQEPLATGLPPVNGGANIGSMTSAPDMAASPGVTTLPTDTKSSSSSELPEPDTPQQSAAAQPSVAKPAVETESFAAVTDDPQEVYRVQIGSWKTESEARRALRHAMGEYPELLGMRGIVRLVNIPERGNFFRAQLESLDKSGDMAFVQGVCNQLKERGSDCFVTRVSNR